MAELEELRKTRLEKVRKMRQKGVDPYPEKMSGKRSAVAEVLKSFGKLKLSKTYVFIAGRVVGMRSQGGVAFWDILDESGKMQVFISRKNIGKKAYEDLEYLDLGDFVSVKGTAFMTKAGEKSLEAKKVIILSKALLPLPSQWYGLHDVEERFRNRELDLVLNKEVKKRFYARSFLIQNLRDGLMKSGFLEVETPILQTIPGGANANPFMTTLKALNLPLYLRVAPELYLKRLLVGGFEKVFELGRVFRNEGMDQTHNPEFTELEFYWAYQDFNGLLAFSEKFVQQAIKATVRNGSMVNFRNQLLDFNKPFLKLDFAEIFKKKTGLNPLDAPEDALREKAREFNVPSDLSVAKRSLVDHIFKKAVLPGLIRPCFVVMHPVFLAPLAKASRKNTLAASRFQMIAGGIEFANAFAELNDPAEQRERFLSEESIYKKGDAEAQRLDEDFIRALEYGMPPAAGFGLGVDRLAMILTDAPSLREVILFPTMKPKSTPQAWGRLKITARNRRKSK